MLPARILLICKTETNIPKCSPTVCCMVQRLFERFMGSIASIRLYVRNRKLFKRRGVMNPFPSGVTLQMRLYQIGIIALIIRHYRTNERKGTSDYNRK
jgi:hypothetical protein